MAVFENLYIHAPNSQGDGLTLCDGNSHTVRNCLIDLASHDIADIDEAIGITWGSSAIVEDCVFRSAGKLALCGSGDKDKAALELGKKVVFRNCLFENFGRRGPEVQCGMQVVLENCVIRQWAAPSRFSVRSFGAWAHGEGTSLIAENCVFDQEKYHFRHFLTDLANHIGQAFNDGGWRALFTRHAWTPGICRGLTASDGAIAVARNCWATQPWIVLDNALGEMDEYRAMELVVKLDMMKVKLMLRFGLLDND